MQVKALSGVVKLASRISNSSSLTDIFRSIELGPKSVRCCSEFGNIEIVTEDTGLQSPYLLETTALRAVLDKAAGEVGGDIEFKTKDDRIHWKSGNANGKLNIVASDHTIPKIDHTSFPWTPPQDLPDALDLASSACQAAAVAVGLYGITIEPVNGRLRLLSSNSIALAASSVDKGNYPAGKITIRPPVPNVIATLLSACPNCAIDISNGIYIKGDWLTAHLPLGNNLQADLVEIADRFTNATQVVKISNNAVRRFITMARALSDRNTSFTIGLKVQDGAIALEHSGISSDVEEFFIADGLDPTVKYESVQLPADMLLVPLSFIDSITLDYLGTQQLVLRGSNPEFIYIVGGS